jgi:hypothetical protein
MLNNPDSEADITVVAVSASGQAVPEVEVALGSPDGVVISPGSGKTDANGTLMAKMRLLSRTNRAVGITATAGAVTGTASILIQGATLSATVETPNPTAGSTARVRFSLTDASSNPMPGETIRITSSLNNFQPITAPMDGTGTYVLQYTATNTGTDIILAEAAGARPLADPRLQIGGPALPPPSAPPASFSLQAQPATVDVNASGSSNRAQLIARVFDAANVPVQNAQVKFRISAGSQFGALATTDTVLTDGSGFARTDFIAGATGSAQDQVKVCAIVLSGAPTPSNPIPDCLATESGVALTVRETPVSIVIGSSSQIIVVDDLTYKYQFVIQVARVGGAPVKGAVVTIDPLEHAFFYKGFWSLPGRTQTINATCANEDANRNDILETGEDINGNLRLDPRRPVNFVFLNGSTTNDVGQVIVEIVYPKSYGSWVSLELSARVTVGGSESRASVFQSQLLVAQPEVTGSGSPAFATSPFGLQAGCNNIN